MDFNEVIEKRMSVRSFKAKKVDWRIVMEAIDSALKGPYAGNMNNLKFLIIENPDLIKELSKQAQQTWINEATIVVAVCSDDTNLERLYGERGRLYSRQQSGAAIENFLLKIVDLGLSACWVGAFSDEIIKNNLGIPAHIQIEALIPVGYEKVEKGKGQKPKKQQLEGSLFWERWGESKRPSAFEENKKEFKKE